MTEKEGPERVARQASDPAGAGRRAGARDLACLHHGADLWRGAAAAVLLLQSGRRRGPRRQDVRAGHGVEASLDHAVGIDARVRYRRGCGRAGRLLVRAQADGRGRVRPLREDDQRAAARVLAPIFTLWFGLGIWSKVALGVTLVFFIVFFNVYQGVREVTPTVLANARMLGMNERQLMRHVYWPSALSWMFSSLHTSVGFAVVGAVVGEYLGSAAGLGYLIQ